MESLESSGQVVALQDRMTCRISSVAILEICVNEEESLMCSVGVSV